MRSTPINARRSTACASDAKGSLYFFGGVGRGGSESILDVSDDMWVYDPMSDHWDEIQRLQLWPPARRCAGFIGGEDTLYLWGGSGIEPLPVGSLYTFLNDLWTFDTATSTWTLIQEACPRPPSDPCTRPGERYTPNLARIGTSLFLFGGYTEDVVGKRKLNDAWVLQNDEWREIPFDGPAGYAADARWPGVRYGAQSTADGTAVYILGGFSDEGDHNDLWMFRNGEFELISSETDSIDVPMPRYCAAFQHHDGHLYLFGGRSRSNPRANYSDLWRFDLAERRWTELHGHGTSDTVGFPTPGYHAKSSDAIAREVWYLWGGEGPHGHVSDFWAFNFNEARWSLLSPPRNDDPIFW